MMSKLSEQAKIWLLFSSVVAILSALIVLLVLHPWTANFLILISGVAAFFWVLYGTCREFVRSNSRRKNL